MKAKIVCSYDGFYPEIDEYLTDNMRRIGADFVGSGFNFVDEVRELEFEISIGPVVDKG